MSADRAIQITDDVYAAAKSKGLALRGLHAAVLRRVKELLRAVGDPDQVELVVRTAVDRDGARFVAGRSLAWGSYEFLRDALGVRDGCWRWALWSYTLPPGRLRTSVDYWRGQLDDGLDAVDSGTVERAQDRLTRLWETSASLEEAGF